MLVSWPTTILLARLLDPSDYGYLALVTVFTRFGSIVAEAGISSTVLLGPELSESQYAKIHGLSATLFACVAVGLVLLAVPIELIYRSDGLRWVLIALSTAFLAEGLMVVPVARMRRAVRLREIASAEASRVLVDAVTAVTLALLGQRHWALVGGYLAGISTYSLFILRASRMWPARPGIAGIENPIRNAKRVMVGSVSTFLASSADAWIGAGVVGATNLGGYSYMNSLSRSPLEKISGVVTYSAASLLGNLGADPQRITSAMLRIVRSTAIVMFPVFVGIALVAEPLVLSLLGAKWQPYVLTLQLLCAYAAMQPILHAIDQVIVALGQTRTSAINGIINLVLLPPSFFFLGKAIGPAGLALAWFVPLPLVMLRSLWIVKSHSGVQPVEISRAVGRPLLAAGVMSVAVVGLAALLPPELDKPLFRLVSLSLLGALVYVSTIWIVAEPDVRWLGDRVLRRRTKHEGASARPIL